MRMDCYPDQDTLQPQGGFKMTLEIKNFVQCPFCNSKTYREGESTGDMARRFSSHITFYHVMGLSE